MKKEDDEKRNKKSKRKHIAYEKSAMSGNGNQSTKYIIYDRTKQQQQE